MADVRLTATNPEDSSVVPVACNSKGELLVDKPVIEQIDNDVTIDGNLKLNMPSDFWRVGSTYIGVTSPEGLMVGELCHYGGGTSELALVSGGYRGPDSAWVSNNPEGVGNALGIFMGAGGTSISFCVDADKETGSGRGITNRFTVNLDGGQLEALRLGPLNGQKGATIDVGEELEFLRAQVRALMEKLKMSPEGGWPVWDGSTET